jgi:hypothetical protein
MHVACCPRQWSPRSSRPSNACEGTRRPKRRERCCENSEESSSGGAGAIEFARRSLHRQTSNRKVRVVCAGACFCQVGRNTDTPFRSGRCDHRRGVVDGPTTQPTTLRIKRGPYERESAGGMAVSAPAPTTNTRPRGTRRGQRAFPIPHVSTSPPKLRMRFSSALHRWAGGLTITTMPRRSTTSRTRSPSSLGRHGNGNTSRSSPGWYSGDMLVPSTSTQYGRMGTGLYEPPVIWNLHRGAVV